MTAKVRLTPLSSPREMEGTLVVVEDKEEIGGLEGVILAAESIPRSWVPQIIRKCKGAIIWRGGYLSHLAIIAREFRFPVFRSERPIPRGEHKVKIREGEDGWWMYL